MSGGASTKGRLLVSQGGTPTADLAGARVLVIEDEMLITMLLEDILDELGCSVVGSAVNLRQSEDLVSSSQADVAILDVNLGGDPVFPIAERLTERNVPIVFASGYGASGLPERWQGFTTLPKPFTAEQVQTALRTALTR